MFFIVCVRVYPYTFGLEDKLVFVVMVDFLRNIDALAFECVL